MSPHDFSSLLTRQRKSSVFAGAGLSFGLVPDPAQLMSDRIDIANSMIGNVPTAENATPLDLYTWSDKQLEFMANDPGEPPKLRLAKSLGLLDDPRWGANIAVRIAFTTPRHRVIARFARERLWDSVWTWNWDCEIERALEAIGFARGAARSIQPWLTTYRSIVTGDDFTNIADEAVCCIFKPHGCAQAVAESDRAWTEGNAALATELSARFMVGADELSETRTNPTDNQFNIHLTARLASNPAMIVGWSMSEPYLQSVITQAVSARSQTSQIQELSVIDIQFRQAHANAAQLYGLTQEQVFFQVEPSSDGFNTDRFFLCLQALFCVSRMAQALPDNDRPAVMALRNLGFPPCEELLLDWADIFIPAWTRLCWRSEVVECANFDPFQLDLDAPDEHIPLFLEPLPRPDLQAAARLFPKVMALADCDLRTFPGGLWFPNELKLVVPLPAWGELNELAGLRPWVTDQTLGLVEHVQLLPLHFDPLEDVSDQELLTRLKAKLAQSLNSMQFSDPENLDVAVI